MMHPAIYAPATLAKFGLLMALLMLLADQITKHAVLTYYMNPPAVLPITSFFNLQLVWNRGVSFGLLYHEHDYMPFVLIAIALGICLWLAHWLRQAANMAEALALGAVIGGAIGNVIDRIRFGAVVDFLDFHYAGWHWPSFNIADASIVVGVITLLLGNLLGSARNKA